MIILGCDNFGKELANKINEKQSYSSNKINESQGDSSKARFLLIEKRVFPDNEVCPRILNLQQEADNIKDEIIIFANRMTLPIDPNKYLMENLLLLKTINALKPSRIGVIFPYLVYSRQDKVFRDGEPLSIKSLFDFLHSVGATEFFTISSHAERDKNMLTAPMPAYNINGFESIAQYFAKKKDKLKNPIVVAPDKKSEKSAEIIANRIDGEFCAMEKHRNLDTGNIETQEISANVKDRDVILIDDIISSGKTMLNAINIINSKKPRRIYCSTVHLILQQGLEKTQPYVTKLLSTNTIQTPVSNISVIPQLADKLREHYK